MRSKESLFLIITMALSGVVVMISCTNKKGQADVAPDVSFSKNVVPVLTASCAIDGGCHAGTKNTGDNLDLDSSAAYNTITTKSLINFNNLPASLLYVEITSGTMPKAPYDNMDDSKKNLILDWIKQGAKNN